MSHQLVSILRNEVIRRERRKEGKTDDGWLKRGGVVLKLRWFDDPSVCRKRTFINCHTEISNVLRLPILKILVDDNLIMKH